MIKKKTKKRFREKHSDIIKLTCAQCYKKFKVKKDYAHKIWGQNQAILCSQKCRNLTQSDSGEVPKRVCIHCNARFVPMFFNQNYCSKPCSIKNRKNRRHTYLKHRMQVFDRDGFRCRYCGISVIDNKDVLLEIDHIIPKSKGGTNNIDNLITSCSNCNRGKGDVLLNYNPMV